MEAAPFSIGTAVRGLLTSGAGAALLGMGANAAIAQDNAASASDTANSIVTLEQVVVTAQRRAESQQDVPIAITALTADSLTGQKIANIEDLNMATPNLNVARSVKTQLVFLRGVGNNSTNPGQEQSVAVYVDGVYYPAPSASVFGFNNLERVEVLRGPQGTLFGRNSTGGLIQVITRDPSHDPTAEFSLGYGNYETVEGSAYLASGLTDSLAADIAIQARDQGKGWGHNVYDGREVHKGNDINVRTKWVYEPSDRTKLTFSGSYFDGEGDDGTARQVLPGTPVLPPSHASTTFNGNIYDTNSNAMNLQEIEQYSGALRWDQDLDFARLVSISAYQRTEVYNQIDLDQTPANLTTGLFGPELTKSFSQELQLLSPDSSPFDWIVGLYYFWADSGSYPLRIGTATSFTAYNETIGTDSYAAFAQATFPVFGDNTNLTLGARYTVEERTIDGTVSNPTGVIMRPNQKHDWSKMTYRAALDHHFSDTVMGYVSVSTGFKSGNYNFNSPTARPVDPESLIDYELGVKSELFGRRLQLNLGAFYYDYTDLQLSQFTGTSIALQNAADAEIYGVELDATALLTDRLSMTLGAAALRSEYINFTGATSNQPQPNGLGATTIIDASGNNLYRTPEATLNLGLDYRVPVSVGELRFNGSYYYNDGFFWEADNRLRQKPYSLVNAQVGWTSPDERYGVRLWSRNLLDEEYYVYVVSQNNGADVGSPAEPRTYGVTFDVKF